MRMKRETKNLKHSLYKSQFKARDPADERHVSLSWDPLGLLVS
jgi:hypothetical protein